MVQTLCIIIIDKQSNLKTLTIKDYKEDELYKKCGFKKEIGFKMQVEWDVTLNGQKYAVAMYGKLDGKSNMENKYDFPPPIDKKIYFGSCALVGMIKYDNNHKTYVNLTIELWNAIYEKLFGGFEDLTTIYIDNDDDEEDNLEKIPVSMKTKKGGYLKDNFIIDGSDNEDEEEEDDDDNEIEDITTHSDTDNDLDLEDIGSELSEDKYDYSDDETK